MSLLTKATFRKWREFLENKLKNHRQDNFKRKLPVDAKLLECAQEELAMKKRLVEQVDKMNEKYVEIMERMSNTMDKITNSIANGFSLLRMMCQQPTAMYPAPMYPPASPYTQPLSSYSSSFPPSAPNRTTVDPC